MKTTLYLHIFTRPLTLCKNIYHIHKYYYIYTIYQLYFFLKLLWSRKLLIKVHTCTLFMIIFTHSDLTMIENNELFVESNISTNFTTMF